MRTIRALAVALGLITALTLAGCGADSRDGSGAGEAAQEDRGAAGDMPDEEAAAPGDDAGEEPSGGDTGEDTGGEAAGVLVDDRSIIYTGYITVRVTDVSAAAGQVSRLADRYGGFVGGDQRSTEDDHASASMVLRIPSENFTAAVDALAQLGTEEAREIYTEDVTEEVVDLESRITTARASVTRTRELLERAESIADIVAVEKELAEREARLASLEGRQRRLADLTTLSTITVTLASPGEPLDGDGPAGFLGGLRAGWDAFTTSLAVMVTVLGALLPWLVALGVPAGVLVWWARRRRAGTGRLVDEAGPSPAAETPSGAA